MAIEVHVHARLVLLGVDCTIVGDEIHVPGSPRLVKIKFDEEWRRAFQQYQSARSIAFDEESRRLTHNNSVEALVARLGSAPLLASEQYNYADRKNNTVSVGRASKMYNLAHFDSKHYDEYFERIVKKRLISSPISTRGMDNLVFRPLTALYVHKGRRTPSDLHEIALAAIRSSLFKIALEQHDCMILFKARKRRLKSINGDAPTGDQTIPRANYDETVVSYYKVAKASPFPSQSFLAYYHVLEFYFLTVSELLLHDRLSSMINDPGFRATRQGLDKVISAVRGQNSSSDETEMLRKVLERFVDEAELINFIQGIENECGEKLYSKRRKIFGEEMQISLIKDHALANSAKVLKQLRNAIVHSSDRYKREDSHVPLSESEDMIEEFIPLVRFLAERVICGNAT